MATPLGRSYRIFGVPFRTGSLYPGSENDAQPYRDAELVARLTAAGCEAVDLSLIHISEPTRPY